MLQEGLDALVAVAGDGGALGASELHGRFLVDSVTLLHGRRGEDAGARALHDAAQRDDGKDE